MYRIPVRSLEEMRLLTTVRDEMTVTPKLSSYTKKKKTTKDPEGEREDDSFQVYVEEGDFLCLPLFYGLSKFGLPAEKSLHLWSEGEDKTLHFEGTLRPHQEAPVKAVMERFFGEDGSSNKDQPQGGLVSLPCGGGKTCIGLKVASLVRKKTLVLVEKEFLLDQWKERASTFLPEAKVGIVRQSKVEGDADLVIGILQSFVKREYPPSLLSSFGLVIFDEAHHLGARVFHRVTRQIPARLRLALSATPERKDGLTNLLYWSLGSPCYVASKEEDTPLPCQVRVVPNPHQRRELLDPSGKANVDVMISLMAKDDRRNHFLVELLKDCLERHDRIILMGDRIEMLERVAGMLDTHLPSFRRRGVCAEASDPFTYGWYISRTKKREREEAASKSNILLSTYRMTKEGFDVPSLSCLIMATPICDVEQALGRVQRKHPGKTGCEVVDVVDTYSVFASHFLFARKRFYVKKGYEVVGAEE